MNALWEQKQQYAESSAREQAVRADALQIELSEGKMRLEESARLVSVLWIEVRSGRYRV